MTKKEWLALEPYDRGLHVALGGTVVSETIKRSLFQQLSAHDQRAFVKDGGKLID